MSESFQSLLYTVEDRVAVLTFNRPNNRNALDITMRTELATLLAKIRADKSLCALILTGAGKAFCAGGDLKSLTEKRRTPAETRERIALLHTWFPALTDLEIPVIAAVNGPAYGAGFSFVLAADFVLCSTQARMCSVFGRLGLIPDLGSLYLLPRRVGLQRAKELVFTARSVGPEEALRLGLAMEVHEPDRLIDAAKRFAGRFRGASRDAIGMAKNILNQSLHLDQHVLADMEAFAAGICFSTDYHQEAVKKFLAKEPFDFDWDRMSEDD